VGWFSVLMFVSFILASSAHATVYFSLDAESGTVGQNVPQPPMCGWTCGSDNFNTCGTRPRYESAGGTPNGSKYIQFDIAHPGLQGDAGAFQCPSVPDGVANVWSYTRGQHDHGQELRYGSRTVTGFMDKTFYMAAYFRLDTFVDPVFPSYRQEVFDRGASTNAISSVQSAEKGIELVGEALRWTISMGQWDSYYGNSPGHFTAYIGNPDQHMNPSLEHSDVYWQNQNGYAETNPIQLAYNQWHSAILRVTTKRDLSGDVALWIDGIKISEYMGIRTVGTGGDETAIMSLGGTLCQPAYDCPKHVRKYDAFILTDNWNDIVAGGYLQSGDTTAPAAPTGLGVQ
jgi:hypothetical protein